MGSDEKGTPVSDLAWWQALALTLADRLSRRLAQAHHSDKCENCKGDRELILMARTGVPAVH